MCLFRGEELLPFFSIVHTCTKNFVLLLDMSQVFVDLYTVGVCFFLVRLIFFYDFIRHKNVDVFICVSFDSVSQNV